MADNNANMSERSEPYVGVSGVVSQEQQRRLVELARMSGLTAKRQLLLGVKATHKTQYLDKANRYGTKWYPVGEDAFTDALAEGAVPTYNVAQLYLEPESIKANALYPKEFIRKVVKRGAKVLDALQFDMLPYQENAKLWSHTIDGVKDQGMGVIIQAHAAAMDKGPKQAVNDLVRLSDYSSLDFVLFDASHGTGKEMDADELKRFLEAGYRDIDLEDRGTNFGIAGGLDEYTVETHLPAVLKDFPDISWDAEGRLHPRDGEGLLDMQNTRDYLFASARVLAENEK